MGPILIRLGLFLATVSLIVAPSQSAVSSIDLGSEWVKVAVVNLKPGQSPISVAINEMSKRKSPALVAFQSGARLLGEEAAGIVARYPDKVYSLVRDMIRKPYKHVRDFLDSMYLPFNVVEDDRGAASIKIDDGATVYSAEELAAMILTYAGNLAEFHSKLPVKDAVISVPPYFGQAERKGLQQAAQLAGINVLALINEHSGAALQYGIDKDFSNGSRHVIFYDMGATSTYAALVYFSAYNAKEYGKTVSVNQFQVKDVRWNPKLGGQHMELRLVEYFADEFNKQVGNGVDVRKSPKRPLQVPQVQPGTSARTLLPMVMFQNLSTGPPSSVLQVAVKNNQQPVWYFNDKIPLHVFFSLDGRIERTSFLETWRSLPDSNEISKDFPSIVVNNVEATLDRLAASNMFFIAKRKNANQDVFYFSAKIPRGVPVLTELTTVVGSPGVKSAIKTPSPDMAPLFFEALETLLK